MSEDLNVNECLALRIIHDSITDKMKLLEEKFLDEIIDYQLSETDIKTLEQDYSRFFSKVFITQNNRILVSKILYLILIKIHYEEDITTLEYRLMKKIYGWREGNFFKLLFNWYENSE